VRFDVTGIDAKLFRHWSCRRHLLEDALPDPALRPVPSENLIRWIRSRKENRIMIETDGDLLQTLARVYVGLLSRLWGFFNLSLGERPPSNTAQANRR
jgi:hypothetical protein